MEKRAIEIWFESGGPLRITVNADAFWALCCVVEGETPPAAFGGARALDILRQEFRKYRCNLAVNLTDEMQSLARLPGVEGVLAEMGIADFLKKAKKGGE